MHLSVLNKRNTSTHAHYLCAKCVQPISINKQQAGISRINGGEKRNQDGHKTNGPLRCLSPCSFRSRGHVTGPASRDGATAACPLSRSSYSPRSNISRDLCKGRGGNKSRDDPVFFVPVAKSCSLSSSKSGHRCRVLTARLSQHEPYF